MRQKVHGIIIGLAMLVATGPTVALVMDFGAGSASTITTSVSYNQNGLTMTPIDSGSFGTNHWDWFKNSGGATVSDWHAGIHTGNNGEEVQFTFGGQAFDLLSIDIEAIIIDGGAATSETAIFTSSSGASTTASSVGTVDFTGLGGFQNITAFNISMPLGVGDCNFADCVTMMLDDVQFRAAAPVPLPAAWWLFGTAIAVLRWRKRKSG